jgi:hypothetical protein
MAQRRRYTDYDDTGTAKYLLLTEGERAIWAAAFNRIMFLSEARMTFDEQSRLAARCAHDTVKIARRLAVSLRDDDSETAFMARQMVNRLQADGKQDDEMDGVYAWLNHNGYEKTLRVFCEEAGIEPDDMERPTVKETI